MSLDEENEVGERGGMTIFLLDALSIVLGRFLGSTRQGDDDNDIGGTVVDCRRWCDVLALNI